MFGYLGSYYSAQSKGIFRFTFDAQTGALSAPQPFADVPNSKYVALDALGLVSATERDGKSGICRVDIDTGKVLQAVCTETTAPCYVCSQDGRIYTANYHEGTVLCYDAGTLAILHQWQTGAKSGAHQVLWHEGHVLAVCLLQDCIWIYKEGQETPIGSIAFPKGAGPRHGVFNKAHTRLYVASELSGELFVCKVEGLNFTLLGQYPILQEGTKSSAPPATAAIRLSTDERFLTISTRFAEVITVFSLTEGGATRIQQTPCGGEHPRDCMLSPDGRFLLVANRTRGGLCTFARCPQTGHIGGLVSQQPVPETVSIVLAPT